MLRVSTAAATLLVIVFLLGSISYAESQSWPLKGRIDLSSGFGDYRLTRFHAGVDLRTGGKIGQPVFSPVDGSVWRIKMSYHGYGKGLYIKGDDGHIYVFGHLSALSDRIDRTVKEAQNRAQRYYVDLSLPADSLPVKKGEQIALSGQTGVGAPHLHFEIRSPNNQPLNPLEYGFELNDKVRPTFVRIGFQLTDDHSLFPDGNRVAFVTVKKAARAGEYELDTVLYLSSPFGVLVDCYDQMRAGSMRQSIHRLTLSIDQLEFDHVSAAEGEKRIRRLFHRPGNEYFGSGGAGESNGIIGLDSTLSNGVHEGLIEAEDSFGNKSRLEFKFMWGPEEAVERSLTDAETGEPSRVEYTVTDKGLVVKEGGFTQTSDVAFLRQRPDMMISVVAALKNQCAFFPADSECVDIDLVGLDVTDTNPADGVLHEVVATKSVNISAVGYSDHTMFSDDSLFKVHTTNETFYEPRFLAIEDVPEPDTAISGLVSPCYRILPDAFVTAQPFEVELAVDPKSVGVRSKQAGLCWRDEKESEWVWINEFYEDDTTSGLTPSEELPEPRGYYPSGSSLGGGMFAVLIDTTAPTLSGIKDDRFIDARINGRWLIPEYEPEMSRCRVYPYQPLPAGRCELMIVVEDRAGNVAEHRVNFFVKE